MRKLLSLVLLSAAPFIISCEKNSKILPEKEVIPVNPGTLVSTGLNNELLLKLVNDVRTKGCNCGTTVMPPVAALTWNNLLAAAALTHSKDMNTNNYFSHTSLDGKNPGDRITASGYKWMSYGENIAAGQPNEQAVFDAWLSSEGHCKNIMNANFRDMGVAKDGRYWTQEFGRQ
ncbi:CAP domain-containing protein [Pedobacter aquatilis]|uniref:CAP domain-containing protein n=1 Tax=Pedobacter aquatilis TaxID=351343 RepID=UPI0025B37C54|nr:CAP domain-containing protein [Pedobacter aquatilis]MDN3586747.1 CAP domain-containing protein [Pedobacter aquatilis]